MIEIYLAVSLLGLGYIFNKNKEKAIPTSVPQSFPSTDTSTVPQSHYHNTRIEDSRKIEKEAVAKHLNSNNEYISELLNKPFQKGEYIHNNMVPFFKGSGTNQNVDPDANISVLEMYGVKDPSFKPKKEINPLFDPTKNIKPVTNIQDVQDRMYVSRIQNNVLPFEQLKVGPGMGTDFGSKPKNGFNPLMDDEIYRAGVLPKTIDELRTKTNPKETYKSRILLGKKIDKRSQIGKVNKNENKESFFSNGPERYMKTTGAFLKPKVDSVPMVKDTHRKTTTKEYKGNPHINRGLEARSKVRAPFRNMLPGFGKGVATLNKTAPEVSKYDYGKKAIQVYANERDITSTKTYEGNVTTVVKSIIAPLQDILKRNKKEYYVEAAREYGNMSIQIPEKITVRDPNDVTRTTIKETTIHDAQRLNLRGSTKISVYDPNAVARTTIKETLIHDGQLYNLVPPKKEGRIQTEIDPTAKKTVRETLEEPEKVVNMRPPAFKQTVYDPEDVARNTMKQTTLVEDMVGGVDAKERRNAAYVDKVMEAKMTMKETYADNDYYGAATTGTGEAYKNVSFDVRTTMKEQQKEYFGGAADQTAEGPMDYTSVIENATTNGIREAALVVNHEPTLNSVKVSQGADTVHVDVKRMKIDTVNPQRARVENVPGETTSTYTRTKQFYEKNDRLDPDLLEPFRKNPYTQPLPGSASQDIQK